MRFSTFLNNKKCMEWKLNAQQGILFSLLYDCSNWAKEVIVDGQTYYFISRNLVINELPMFFEKPDTVYREFKKLFEKGLIKYIKKDKMDLIRITEKGKEWNFSNSENNSEKNPSKFGKNSENNSEKNPTNKDTNIQKDINKNNKEKYKKEKKQNEIQEFINNLDRDAEYKELLFKYVEYRKNIKKPLKTIVPMKKILKDFPDWFSLDEAINIAMEKEWQGLEPEWIAKYKQSKANNNYGKQAEQKDTSQLKVDDDFIEQMKERYGIND